MQRVVLLGDTHLPRFGRSLPAPIADALAHADRVLHVGDITEPFVLDLLARYAPTDAVAGNNDGPELQERLGVTRVVEIEGIRIGMTHGHRGAGRTTPERARGSFDGVDAIAFGHSHQPMVARDGGVWLLNPGSPTDRRRQPTFSFLALEIARGEITPQLVTYAERRAPRRRAGRPIAPHLDVNETDGGELPGPRDDDDAERMARNAREAERHITELHEESDPDDNPIHEE
jgi:putative phosphoesterase